MLAALRRGATAGEAAATAASAFAEAQAGVARLSEAEKAFTSRVRSPTGRAFQGRECLRVGCSVHKGKNCARPCCRGVSFAWWWACMQAFMHDAVQGLVG